MSGRPIAPTLQLRICLSGSGVMATMRTSLMVATACVTGLSSDWGSGSHGQL
jgi:hypothetical protein